jgi:hypothetical protein
MPRSPARRVIAAPSPGRSRMVIRSVARICPDSGASAVAGDALPSGSIKVRIATSARADSDIPVRSASCAKRAFSAGEGRAVIEGSDTVARQLMSKFSNYWRLASLIDLGRRAAKHVRETQKNKAGFAGFSGRNLAFLLSLSTRIHGRHASRCARRAAIARLPRAPDSAAESGSSLANCLRETHQSTAERRGKKPRCGCCRSCK